MPASGGFARAIGGRSHRFSHSILPLDAADTRRSVGPLPADRICHATHCLDRHHDMDHRGRPRPPARLAGPADAAPDDQPPYGRQDSRPAGGRAMAGAHRRASPSAFRPRTAAPGRAALSDSRPRRGSALVPRFRTDLRADAERVSPCPARVRRAAEQRHRPQRRHQRHRLDASDASPPAIAGVRRRLRPVRHAWRSRSRSTSRRSPCWS